MCRQQKTLWLIIGEQDNQIIDMTVSEKIYESYVHLSENKWARPHLGASQLGHPCDRFLWLSLRHVAVPESSKNGRVLRLFDSGNLQEPRLLKDLSNIGVTVVGTQFNFRDNKCSIISGSCDGIAFGFEEYPNENVLLEFKTSNTKNFNRLKDHGVKSDKFVHYVQMNIYMHWANLKHALYIVVCKETDEIYTEWVNYDDDCANIYLNRARKIVMATDIPEKLRDNKGRVNVNQFNCRFCDCRFVCHEHALPLVNCRTCYHCCCNGKTFVCNKNLENFESNDVKTECPSHLFNPDILNWQVVDVDLEKESVVWISPYGGRYDSSKILSKDFDQLYKKENEKYLLFVGNDFV